MYYINIYYKYDSLCIATENKFYLPYLKQLIPNLIILGMNMEWEGYMMKPKLVNFKKKIINV